MPSRSTSFVRVACAMSLVTVLSVLSSPADAQDAGRAGGRGGRGGRGSQTVITDTARARELFVSNRHEDHRQANFDQQIQQRLVAESTTVARSRGVLQYTNVKYKSSVGGMEIPASLYQPLQKGGAGGRAARGCGTGGGRVW